MSALKALTLVRSLVGIVLGVVLMGCGTSVAHNAEATRNQGAARPLVALNVGTAYPDHATNTHVSRGNMPGKHVAMALVPDRQA